MNLEPTPEQQLVVETFARFLDENSSPARVRAALPVGFDRALWTGLAELGAFGMRVPEAADGLGMGAFDATLVMEQMGRTLASGPVAEAIVTARLLAKVGGDTAKTLLGQLISGDKVVVLALHDVAEEPEQWVQGGLVADSVIVRNGDSLFAIEPSGERHTEKNLGDQPMAKLALKGGAPIARGAEAVAAFEAAVEEWKLLVAAALGGLSKEAIRLASEYACERHAFGVPIGTYQAVSHPLADCAVYTDGARMAVWSAIRAVADGAPDAAAQIGQAFWLASDSATKSVVRALHTFGGYGLTLEYDIHLYNTRAKAWPLMYGDPVDVLDEIGQRRYHDAKVSLPEVGDLPINFDVGDKARAMAAETRAFFEKTLTPELRAKAHFSTSGHDAGVHKKLAEAGLLYAEFPPELGGRSANAYEQKAAYAVWSEYNWTGQVAGLTRMVAWCTYLFGSDEAKSVALKRMIEGESTACLGFSEPGSGSDVFAAKTRATRDGDGWRINGSKMFTSGAQYADYILILTRTDPDVPKHKGLTTFLLPMKSEGVTIQAVETFQEERTNITYYDNVYVPDSYRLNPVNEGLKTMLGSLGMEHTMSLADVHGRLLKASEQYARENRRKNRVMIDDPLVYTRLAKVASKVLAAEMVTHRALWSVAENKPIPAVGPSTKMFTSEVYQEDSADMMDLVGTDGLLNKTGPASYVNLCYRHSQVGTVYGGTSEVHRSMIAEKQLGLPRTRN